MTQLGDLIAPATEWCLAQETWALRNGVVLNEEESAFAQRIGVQNIERVRLWRVEEMPRPAHPLLQQAIAQTGFFGAGVQGITFRYGILIHESAWRDKDLVAHELVHVSQYERLGGFEMFLRRYLSQCLTLGYHQAPLEIEARQLSPGL